MSFGILKLCELWNVEIELGEVIFEIFELSKVSFGMMKLGEVSFGILEELGELWNIGGVG